MKNLLYLLLGSALLVPPSLAQTDLATGRDISLSEFRQCLYDIGAMIDRDRGTNFAVQVQGVPDDTLAAWYKGVPDGRRFQDAVRGLKDAREGRGTPVVRRRAPNVLAMAASQQLATPMASPLAQSSPFASVISSVTLPSYTLTLPKYPNPATDSNWEAMVQAIITWMVYVPGDNSILPVTSGTTPDYPTDAYSPCDSNLEARITVVVATLEGIKDMAKSVCEIVPDIFVEILGEGAEVPTKEICFAVTLIISGFQEWFSALGTDCDTQDRIINVAEGQAALANSVVVYNLKLRLKIEQNLESSAGPMGLFELPTSLGGYLEIARAIVADTITQMQAAGYSMSAAVTALNQGDTYFNSKNYKQAYKSYQTAYLAAK